MAGIEGEEGEGAEVKKLVDHWNDHCPHCGGIINHVPPGSKQCSHCHQVKTLSEFMKSSRHRDGFNGICKECIRPYKREKAREYAPAKRRPHIKKERKKKECPGCGQYFSPWPGTQGDNQIFCSRRCYSTTKTRDKKRKSIKRINSALECLDLKTNYLKRLIKGSHKLDRENITAELVEIKRQQIVWYRALKQAKEELQNGTD